MTVDIKKMRDIVNDFNDWSITPPPHGQVVWTNNTGPAHNHKYDYHPVLDDPTISPVKNTVLDLTDINKQIRDLVEKHGADILNDKGCVTGGMMDTSPEETLNSFTAQLEAFEMPEIVKINALKRHAQTSRTLFLHKVSNAMVNHKWTDKVVIAGGCFTSWYHNEPLKDIDVFILDSTYITDALYQCVQQDPDRFKVGNSSYMSNAKVSYTAFDKLTKIQYIVSEFKTREELLAHFDCEHDCISFVENKLYISREAFDAMRTKTLKSHNGNKIAGWRKLKFLGDRGFRTA